LRHGEEGKLHVAEKKESTPPLEHLPRANPICQTHKRGRGWGVTVTFE